MRTVNTKVDGVDSMPAENYNAQRDELENAVLSADITLDPDAGPDTDLNMLGKAMAAYANAGNVYQDSGVADAYVLSITTNLKTVPKYYDNMMVMFKAGTTNTGASTVNVNTLGVKSLTLSDGTALAAGNITAGRYILANYSLSNDRFELVTGAPASSLEYNVYIHATDGDYPTLAAYLAASPVAGDSVLYDADETFTATITIPADIQIQQVFGREITANSAFTTLILMGDRSRFAGRLHIVLGASAVLTQVIYFNNTTNADIEDALVTGSGTSSYLVRLEGSTGRNKATADTEAGVTISTALVLDNSGTANNDVAVMQSGVAIARSDGANVINGLATKVIEIGDWNMDTTTGVNVAHGLTFGNIRSITVIIRNDGDTSRTMLGGADVAGALGGSVSASTTNIVPVRVTGGSFDTADYDSTSYNRGWIIIVYEA